MLKRFTLLAALLAGCSGPSAPTPVERAIPPSAAANACAPVAQFGNAWFHMGDVRIGTSCLVYLEQDECVLAIFEDCPQYSSDRQWQGRIGPDREVELWGSRIGRTAIVERCRGTLPEEAVRLELDCGNGALLLDRQLESFVALGEIPSNREVALIDPGSFATRPDLAGDLEIVDRTEGREVWVTLDIAGGELGGIHRFLLPNIRDRERIPLVSPQKLIPLGNGSMLVVAEEAFHVIDTETLTQTASASAGAVFDRIEAQALSLDGQTFFLATDHFSDDDASSLTSWDVSTLTKIEEIETNVRVDTLVPIATSSLGAVLIAYGTNQARGRGDAIHLDASLDEKLRTDLPREGEAAAFAPSEGIVRLVGKNSYYEHDLATSSFSDPIGVPYFQDLEAVVPDESTGRVYVGGLGFNPEEPGLYAHQREGFIATIDLARQMSLHDYVRFENGLSEIVFDDINRLLIIRSGRFARIRTVVLR